MLIGGNYWFLSRLVSQLLLEQGENEASLPYATKAFEIAPNNPNAIQLYTTALLRQKWDLSFNSNSWHSNL